MTSISMPFAILKGKRSGQSSAPRHHDADGPIHEGRPRESREVSEGDRLLRPDHAADLGRRAGRTRSVRTTSANGGAPITGQRA